MRDPNPIGTGPTKSRADHCTTHHHACDCREWEHACRIEQLEAALEAAREDAEEVARWRFVRTLGKLPVRCSTGYYYEDGVLHPTLNEAIDQARGKGGKGVDGGR